ncbi:MAG: MaoC family dehydratase [Burkholderiales bacterium]|nr:MaoC family dehydratase [Burkholderiales bacterium]
MSEKPIFNYAHYEPGEHYGARDFAVDETTVSKWRSVYPHDDDPGVMPAGMLAMIVIDAVLTLNAPRPPGGVHGGQTFDVRRMPRIGETLRTDVWCLDKEIKKERKWVRVRSETRAVGSNELLFTGVMTTLVAQ